MITSRRSILSIVAGVLFSPIAVLAGRRKERIKPCNYQDYTGIQNPFTLLPITELRKRELNSFRDLQDREARLRILLAEARDFVSSFGMIMSDDKHLKPPRTLWRGAGGYDVWRHLLARMDAELKDRS